MSVGLLAKTHCRELQNFLVVRLQLLEPLAMTITITMPTRYSIRSIINFGLLSFYSSLLIIKLFEERPFKKSTIGGMLGGALFLGVGITVFAVVFQNKKNGFWK